MASNKKSKNINKRLTHEASPQIDLGKPIQRSWMKKPSDKLGPQWTKGELERFYNAYQKHGRDWKKVASAVWSNRSVDMVEALFSINKAYLSLPEGTASLAGFIAMMTDHYYSVMEESKSEGEGHGASAVPKIHQKRKRAKILPSDLRKEGCLALLKQTQAYGRKRPATAKRTSRVNVADNANEALRTKPQKEWVYVEASRDELEALQTLDGLSVLVPPADLMETEPSAPLKGERIANNLDKKSYTPNNVSTSHYRETPKQAEPDDSGKLKSVQGLIDGNGISVEELGTSRRIHKPKESANDYNLKTLVEERPVGQSPAKQLKTAKISEEFSSTGDKTITGLDAVASATQVSGLGPASLPQKPPNRRKMSLKKSLQERAKFSETTHSYKKNSEHELLQEKVSTCLSCPLVRRRCIFEWFYSAIDYPWFAKMEFIDYLSHVGFGHIPELTRLEWSVIKSSIGKPRRFSERFIQGERDKLKQYRESVRQIYTEIRSSAREGIPIDLSRPLSVGDRVIAIHPKTHEICDGKILTVNHNKCNVLFDDLGVDLVMDIDCMPINPPVKQRMEREMLGIVSGSRSIAQKMVDAAMKAASSVKDEEDTGKMVQQALDNFVVPCIKQQDQSNGSLGYQQQQSWSTLNKTDEKQMASELITSCVATSLMIKVCTEKRYPSEDVARIMETAMSGLKPRGPQNMPIYREIQTYMGLIRTQIMALVRR